MGSRRSNAAGSVSKAVAPTPRPVIIGHDAEKELTELLDYVQTQSSRNANLVSERIAVAVERLARNPDAATVDPDSSGLPADAVAHRTRVSGYTIRYVYPVAIEGEPTVLIVSIRRSNREALNDPAYLLRWLEERARARP